MYKLGFSIIPDLENLHAHAFCCPLVIPIEEIKLTEGLDLGLFPLKEVMARELYSLKMESHFLLLKHRILVIPYESFGSILH